jgi:hypothetical protein
MYPYSFGGWSSIEQDLPCRYERRTFSTRERGEPAGKKRIKTQCLFFSGDKPLQRT